jgi:hypothetical protein
MTSILIQDWMISRIRFQEKGQKKILFLTIDLPLIIFILSRISRIGFGMMRKKKLKVRFIKKALEV